MSSCITTTTVIKNCDNPIYRLLNPILTGGLGSLERILDKGMLTPYCGCCPCPEDEPSIYILGKVEDFLNFFSSGVENVSCCSTFNEAINQMRCLLKDGDIYTNNGNNYYSDEFDYLLSQGIIEVGLINNQSQLMIIIEWYKSNISILSKKKIDLFDILDLILQKTIVITCNQYNAGTSISSLETYLKLYEAVGSPDFQIGKPCCINLFAEPEKANLIKNGVG